ncbi:hypothetical protein [Burkholderia stagnalis]|nr:hypothetical protein [Burkholderia stagnalis]
MTVPLMTRAHQTKTGESDVVDFRSPIGRALHLSLPCVDQARAVLIRAIRQEQENIGESMSDLVFILVTLAFFALTAGFINGLDRI